MQRIANNPIVIQTYIATAAVVKYQAVIPGTNADEVTVPGGAGVLAVGVAMNAADAGEPVDVCMFGPYLCRAAAAITRGTAVKIADTSGRVDDVTLGVTTLVHVVGTALEAATAPNDLISVFVGHNPHGATT